MTKLQTKTIIAKVELVRRRNNKLWMALLALAIGARPRKAKAIIRKICENDKEVSQWLNRI